MALDHRAAPAPLPLRPSAPLLSLLVLAAPLPLCPSAPLLAAQSAPRDSLRLAEQRLSEAVFRNGLPAGLAGSLAEDAVLLLEGAPIVRGRAAVAQLSARVGLGAQRLSWAPFRVLLSEDRLLGVTFGGTVVQGGEEMPNPGRYMTVWRRAAGGSWQVAAHQQIGLLQPGQLVVPAGMPGAEPEPGDNPFARADLAFAKLAADSGAPLAFARYAAPDGMTFAPTGELNLGPAAIGARLAAGPAATARWVWRPLVTLAAASGDLGVTIGTAEIGSNYSKYLSVWQRQPDGSIRFVLDGGSGRPAP